MAKIDHGKAIKKAFDFALDKKKIGILYITYLTLISLFGIPLYKITTMESAGTSIMQAGSMVGLMFISILIFALVSLLIQLMLIGTYYHKTSFLESFDKIKKYYWRALAVYIVISLISGIAGSIPLIGIVLSLIASMIFLFAMQFILIDKKKFDETIKNSWHLFRTNTLDVFITWLVYSVIAVIIIGLTLVPLIAGIFLYAAGLFDSAVSVGPAVPLWLIAAGFLVILGIVISIMFQAAYLTEIFVKIRGIKKK
ncbi:MAG: hypothetical protein R6U26_01555 [Candidatus Undinarchaeales archaeon]